jgi:hypothetical protein
MWKFLDAFRINRDGVINTVVANSPTAERAGMLLEMCAELTQKDIRKHYLEWKMRQWDASLLSTHEDDEYLEFMKEWIQEGYDYWYSAKGNPPSGGYIPVRGKDGDVGDILKGRVAIYNVG